MYEVYHLLMTLEFIKENRENSDKITVNIKT